MEHPKIEAAVSQELKRLWSLWSEMDPDHVARLARAAAKGRAKPSQGRRAA